MAPHPAYVAYRVGNVVARALPERAVRPFSRFTGVVASKVMTSRAAMVARHQRRVRPDLDVAQQRRAVRDAFSSYAHYWVESFRLPGTSPEALDAGFTHEGFHHIRDAIDEGRGVVLAMPHLGLWEWAAFWITEVQKIRVSAVVEAVEPPELAAWFTALREELGMEIIPLGPRAGSASAAALTDNRILTLLCDRDVAGGGVEVTFFGEPTTLPGGPATLALRSGAALIPATVYFEDGMHRGVARPPLDTSRHGKLRTDVARVTQDLADELETLIRLAPDQWHLLQPNWPSDPPLGEA